MCQKLYVKSGQSICLKKVIGIRMFLIMNMDLKHTYIEQIGCSKRKGYFNRNFFLLLHPPKMGAFSLVAGGQPTAGGVRATDDLGSILLLLLNIECPVIQNKEKCHRREHQISHSVITIQESEGQKLQKRVQKCTLSQENSIQRLWKALVQRPWHSPTFEITACMVTTPCYTNKHNQRNQVMFTCTDALISFEGNYD